MLIPLSQVKAPWEMDCGSLKMSSISSCVSTLGFQLGVLFREVAQPFQRKYVTKGDPTDFPYV